MNGGPQEGLTTVVNANAMATPLVIHSQEVGGPIRSITVGNQTSHTTVNVYTGTQATGTPLFSVVPGNNSTLPIMTSSAVTLTFAVSKYAFDGSVFVHADTQSLAASGFQQTTLIGASGVLPAAASMLCADSSFNLAANGATQQLLAAPGGALSTYLYGFSLSSVAFCSVAFAATLELYSSTAALVFEYQWMALVNGFYFCQVNLATPPGVLPLLSFNSSFTAELTSAQTPNCNVGLNLHYAQF